jgi:dipeptidyl aminopeptidase/acylaminoacyl peptidase
MKMKRLVAVLVVCLAMNLASGPQARETGRRPLSIDDLFLLRGVSSPQISPDGAWVAYTVSRVDREKDKRDSDIWMTSWDGKSTVRLTASPTSEHSPRFSPDGRYISFLSKRDYKPETDQVFIMSRSGGEAERITDLKGGISDYVWSPDGSRLALIAVDPKPKQEGPHRPPIVIDRYQFKQDGEGYLEDRHTHLYLFDLEKREATLLTPGRYDERHPAWSPDSKRIAFVSKRSPDPDRDDNWDLYVIEPKADAAARRLTTYEGADGVHYWASRPAWSPDGKKIAYTRSGDPGLDYYSVQSLAVVSSAGGEPLLPAGDLDRNVWAPGWSADGSAIRFLLEEDRSTHVAEVAASGGEAKILFGGHHHVSDLAFGPDGRIAMLRSTPHEPYEVFALDDGKARPLSRQNAPLIEQLDLGAVEEIEFKSFDGTEIGGLVVKPPGYRSGRRYPAILWTHGGPVGQFINQFEFRWQLFAAHGYVVIGPNPRGSSGRGEAFQKAIWANWGREDGKDVLAAVDHVVAAGIADPNRLAKTGWSYGGMMTNYVIAQDTRFKAAASGAGISNMLAGYGTDQYIRLWDRELGPPWRNLETWLHVSFPFYEAEKIKTPTLFLCGEKDFNVPLLNSEQMYQALRSLGVDTQLIIYPDQYHGLRVPSYQRDRWQRTLDWFEKYLGRK